MKHKGFTLIETMLAVIIIALTSLCAFEAFKFSKTFVTRSELRLRAANFAEEPMENLYFRLSSDAALNLTGGTPVQVPLPTGGDIGLLRDIHNGTRQYEVLDSGDAQIGDTANRYRVIIVTVSWQ